MAAVFVLLVTLFAGPAFALMFKTRMARTTFEKRRARFAEGRLKKDPQTDPIGPHRPFWQNWLLASLIFGTVTAAVLAGLARLGV
ncbi:hypothetical protein [Paracoccus simplex]|uniref:DUF3899 domain-containing protein n=2 Tax=Paracoccus TaxID=265 RepID=A0ABV7S0Z3_9RHOB